MFIFNNVWLDDTTVNFLGVRDYLLVPNTKMFMIQENLSSERFLHILNKF